jgi:hypothetical protein
VSARATLNTWAGVWNTHFGQLTLDASGSGHYTALNPGDLQGSVSGNLDQGTWNQPGNRKAGTFKFTMSGDGRSFTGVWAYNTGGCGSACGWNGTCVSGQCLQNGAGAGGSAGSYPARSGRCILAPRLLTAIDRGLKRDASAIAPVYAVLSADAVPSPTYMVSALVVLSVSNRITPQTPIFRGTWAATNLNQSSLFSVDHIATQVSTYRTLPHLGPSNDGVREANACVKAFAHPRP